MTALPVREAILANISATSSSSSNEPILRIPQSTEELLALELELARLPDPIYILIALDGSFPGRRPAPTRSDSSVAEFSTSVDRSAPRLGPISMRGATMSQFAVMLEKCLETNVLDHTGLTGTFNIELQGTFKIESESHYWDFERLNAALRNQLGLVLTGTRRH